MTIPAWMLLALGLAAAEAVYAVLMAPLDERLPRELKDAQAEGTLREVKRRFRRAWALRTPVMFVAGMVPIAVGAVLTHAGAPGFADAGMPESALPEALLGLVPVGIIGVFSGWLWAGSQIRSALVIAKGLDSEPLMPEEARHARRLVVGLFLGGIAILGTLVLLLAGSGLIDAEATTGMLVGVGAGGAVLTLGLWWVLRPRGSGQDDSHGS